MTELLIKFVSIFVVALIIFCFWLFTFNHLHSFYYLFNLITVHLGEKPEPPTIHQLGNNEKYVTHINQPGARACDLCVTNKLLMMDDIKDPKI